VSLAGAEFGDKKFPGVYETDYIYPAQSSVEYFKNKKMNTVRVPFLWERLQPTLNQAFDATEFARLDLFVTESTSKGMVVVIDPHNYARYRGNLIGSSQVPVSAFANFWTRLATAYKGNDRVIFALMNEPNTMKTEDWLTAANAGAKAVRDTGANNLILVPGNAWTGAHSWTQTFYGTANAQVMKNFVDPKNNFAFEFHQYFDSDYSGVKPECTAEGDKQLAQATQWLVENNYRGFLGEFGGGNNANCKATIERVMKHLEANKQWIGWTWWAAGPWWGSYFLSIEQPTSGGDAPQMSWLTPFLK
jgi:endoglucanase